MYEERVHDQDVARFVERARHGADEGVCEVHVDAELEEGYGWRWRGVEWCCI